MGFSVPRHLRAARCAITTPFHPYPRFLRNVGGLLFCGTFRRQTFRPAARVYLRLNRSYAASRPDGVRTFLPGLTPGATPECQPQLSSEFVSLGRGPLVDSPRLIEPEPFQLVAEDCVQLAPNVVAYGSTGW